MGPGDPPRRPLLEEGKLARGVAIGLVAVPLLFILIGLLLPK
jgi:hypothetical protein